MTVTAAVLFLGTLAVGTAAALVETSGRAAYGPLKMLAATGYLAFALHLGALATPYGRVLFVGLVLAWVGDLFLIGEERRVFLAGLVFFLLAHLAYAGAFAHAATAPIPALAAAAAMAVVAVAVMRWLRAAGLPAGMRVPVGAYLVAIGVMVALAVGTLRPLVAVGAVAFAASDILVARQRFVVRAAINRRVGLPLYFLGQLLIAASV